MLAADGGRLRCLVQPVAFCGLLAGGEIDIGADFGAHILLADDRCQYRFNTTRNRLLDLIDNNAVPLGDIGTLVLDEADRLLALGFADELGRILTLLPALI